MIKDATQLAQDIKNQKLSPLEAVEDAFAKIKDQGNPYQAITHLFEDQALEMAREVKNLDAPFAGVPILLKDAGHGLVGWPEAYGSVLLKDNKTQELSNFTQSLLKAGFIPIGQTNTPEFSLKYVSDSPLYGPVKNVVNPVYHAGGSSGGAASAVQAGIVPIASASDGGGSIRIPASFSGLVGFKPTRGRTYSGPNGLRAWGGAAIEFVINRSVRDAYNVLKAVQVKDYSPMPFQWPLPLEDSLPKTDPKQIRLAYMTQSPGGKPVSDEAVQAVENLVAQLKDAGFSVEEDNPNTDGANLLPGYFMMNAAEQAKTFLAFGTPDSWGDLRGQVEDSTLLLAELGRKIPAYTYSQVFDEWDQLALSYYEFHQTYDILIQPSTAYPAPKLDTDLFQADRLEKIDDFSQLSQEEALDLTIEVMSSGSDASPFAYIYNLTGQPAISLPLHTCQNGLPLGVHLSADKGQDELILALSQWIEDEIGFEEYQ